MKKGQNNRWDQICFDKQPSSNICDTNMGLKTKNITKSRARDNGLTIK